MVSLSEIVDHLDEYLRIREVGDWPNALNGLQIENSGSISRIGAAVDISTRVLSAAAKRKIDFLIVHHGLFWPGLQPVTGVLHRQLRLAFEKDIAVYSAHLPLDLHPVVGNNVQLASALGLQSTKAFFEEKGALIGVKGKTPSARKVLILKLRKVLGGPVKAINRGQEKIKNVGIITGGAGGEIYRVADEGIDTFITGEAPHWAAVAAEELGMNLLLGGHYATETFGVKAMAAQLSKKFGVPFEFIDCPTGL